MLVVRGTIDDSVRQQPNDTFSRLGTRALEELIVRVAQFEAVLDEARDRRRQIKRCSARRAPATARVQNCHPCKARERTRRRISLQPPLQPNAEAHLPQRACCRCSSRSIARPAQRLLASHRLVAHAARHRARKHVQRSPWEAPRKSCTHRLNLAWVARADSDDNFLMRHY